MMSDNAKTMSIFEAATALGLPLSDLCAVCDEGLIAYTKNEVGHHVFDQKTVAALAKRPVDCDRIVAAARAAIEKRAEDAGQANPAPSEPDPDHLG